MSKAKLAVTREEAVEIIKKVILKQEMIMNCDQRKFMLEDLKKKGITVEKAVETYN